MAACHLQSTTISFATPKIDKIPSAPQLFPFQKLRLRKPFFNAFLTRRSGRLRTTSAAVPASSGTESASVVSEKAKSLDSVRVFDLNGKGIIISDLWKDRKAVVAFARHFGCVLCRKRADYLASQKVTSCKLWRQIGESFRPPRYEL